MVDWEFLIIMKFLNYLMHKPNIRKSWKTVMGNGYPKLIHISVPVYMTRYSPLSRVWQQD